MSLKLGSREEVLLDFRHPASKYLNRATKLERMRDWVQHWSLTWCVSICWVINQGYTSGGTRFRDMSLPILEPLPEEMLMSPTTTTINIVKQQTWNSQFLHMGRPRNAEDWRCLKLVYNYRTYFKHVNLRRYCTSQTDQRLDISLKRKRF